MKLDLLASVAFFIMTCPLFAQQPYNVDLPVATFDMFDVGESGDSVSWLLPDFNQGPLSELHLFGHTDSTATVLDASDLLHFSVSPYAVWLDGFENRLFRMAFSQPVFLHNQEFSLSDSLSCGVDGRGLYCDRIPVVVAGEAYSVVDGHGTLRNATLSLHDVFRLHHHQEYDTFLENDESQDSIAQSLGHTVADLYEWWRNGALVPDMQALQVMSVRNGVETSLRRFTRVPVRYDMEPFEEHVSHSDSACVNYVSCGVAHVASSGEIMLTLQSSDVSGPVSVRIFDVSSQCLGTSTVELSNVSQVVRLSPARRPVGGALFIQILHSDFQQTLNVPIQK